MKSQGGKERVLVKYALSKRKEERRGEIIRVLANIKHHSIIRDKLQWYYKEGSQRLFTFYKVFFMDDSTIQL